MVQHIYDYSIYFDKYGATDFIIACQGEASSDDAHVFKIHKAVVKGQSKYLDMLIDGGFQETSKNCAQMQEHPVVVAMILLHMYGVAVMKIFPTKGNPDLEFYCTPEAPRFQDNKLLSQVKVYEAADVWNMPEFQKAIRIGIRSRFAFYNQILTESKERDWHNDPHCQEIEKTLAYLSEAETPCLSDLRKLLSHLCYYFLCVDANVALCKRISFLGTDLYEEAVAPRPKTRCGCIVSRKYENIYNRVQLFVRDADNAIEIVKCHCGFRGLCSETCIASEGFLSLFDDYAAGRPQSAYCEYCLGVEPTSVLYFKSICRLDGKLVFDHQPLTMWSHYCLYTKPKWLDVEIKCDDCGQAFRYSSFSYSEYPDDQDESIDEENDGDASLAEDGEVDEGLDSDDESDEDEYDENGDEDKDIDVPDAS